VWLKSIAQSSKAFLPEASLHKSFASEKLCTKKQSFSNASLHKSFAAGA